MKTWMVTIRDSSTLKHVYFVSAWDEVLAARIGLLYLPDASRLTVTMPITITVEETL